MLSLRTYSRPALVPIVLGLLAVGRCEGGDSLLDRFLPAREVAEEAEEIETDRDSFTPATTLVEQSHVMVESAWSFIDNRDVTETHSFPEILIRYGAAERLELRFGTNYEIGGESSSISQSSGELSDDLGDMGDIEGDANVSYGLKYDVTDQAHWVPDSALILTGTTPTSGSDHETRFTGAFVFGWELENECVLDASIRYATKGQGSGATRSWAPSVVLKAPLGEKVAVHAEYFGIFTDGPEGAIEKQYFSPGIHYTVTPDLEVGVRVGWGLNEQAANFFSNFGVGLLF